MSKKIFYDNYEKLTHSEKFINEYILSNFKKVQDYSIDQLAENTFVTNGTITNYAKKLGLKGFKELIVTINIANKEEEKIIYDNKDIYSFFVKQQKEINKQVLNSANEENLKKDCNILKESKNIYLFAFGASADVAISSNIDKANMFLNKNFKIIRHHTMMSNIVDRIDEPTTIIFLSRKGINSFFLNYIKTSKSKNAKIVSITNESSIQLLQLSDAHLITNSNFEETQFDFRYQQLMLLELIKSIFDNKY